MMPWSITTMLLVAATIFCTSAAQIFQKRAALDSLANELQANELLASEDQKKINHGVPFSKDVLISVFLLGCGLLLWLVVLSRVPVSIAYPLLSINYVIVLLSAKWLFNESIPSHRWVGAFCIVLGICLLVGDAA